jgi:eukaryotic-like serine/threonine-protein kinase
MEDSLPRIFGRYLLVERLNRGGMGEIFLARHGMTGFEKMVVIKKVLPNYAADREFLTRFIDEAQVAVHLQHANIAQVYEVGRVTDEYFLALEYISGSDLRAVMASLVARRNAMPVELALFIAREVANGLAYAHRRTDAGGTSLALVHCDISPPNVMVSFEGEVKIIDFGIARSRRRLTETNPDRGFGKFGYLAPEQLLKGFIVDQRTDVYALGVVLFEMLTGRHMFELGKHPDYRMLARQVVRGEHPLPSAISQSLAPYDDLVATALRPNAGERYQTAAEFRDAIQRALVAVSPTVNPDHLAALLRQLFGDAARRRTMAALNKSDVERWQRQLTSQAGSTVSFATASVEPGTPTSADVPPHDRFDLGGEDSHGGASRSGRAQPLLAPPARAVTHPDSEDQVPTVDQSVQFGGARRMAGWTRQRLIVTVAVLILAGSSGAGAWYGARHLLRGGSSRLPPAAAVPPAPSAALVTAQPAAPPTAVPTAQPGTADVATRPLQSLPEIQVRELPPDEAEAYESPPRAPAREPLRQRRRPDRRRPPGERGGATEVRDEGAPDEGAPGAAVQRRFRALAPEYAAFKERYGARLEQAWQELSHLASYAQSADGIAELDRKIVLFRAQMRAVQKDKDRSIDPF